MPSRSTRIAAEVLRLLPRKRLSRAFGRVTDRRWPPRLTQAAIALYGRAYGVDLTDCDVPDSGYETFGEFFTRQIRPEARPRDPDPAAIVSPADGTVADRGAVLPGATILVKGRSYEIEALLGEPAQAYEGGWFLMVYLHPRDYHRVHAPVGGRVRRVRHVPGTLYPVNAIGEDHVDGLFVQNERVVVFLDQTEGTPPVVVLLIGALGVGRISLAFDDLVTNTRRRSLPDRRYDPPMAIARDDEVGTFHLGSTAVIVVPPGYGEPAGPAAGERILVGQRVGRRSEHAG